MGLGKVVVVGTYRGEHKPLRVEELIGLTKSIKPPRPFALCSVYIKEKDMKLCDTCKKTLCEKHMEIVKQGNLVTIRCKDYEKDESKIQGYRKPLQRTTRQGHTLMNLNI